jgi:hypothetical protein
MSQTDRLVNSLHGFNSIPKTNTLFCASKEGALDGDEIL